MCAKIYEKAKISPETELDLHETALIHDFVLITCKKLVMGKGSQINAGTRITGWDEVRLGKYCVIGYNSVIMTASDTPDGEYVCDYQPIERRKVASGPIIMEDNTFIGSNCTVLPNVTLKEGAFIGANAFVPVGFTAEKWCVYHSGNVAKLQKYRKREGGAVPL